MPTPPGFGDVSVFLTLSGFSRPAAITFGVNPTSTDPAIVNGEVHASMTNAGSFLSRLDSSVTLSRIRVSLGTDGGEDLVSDIAYTNVGSLNLISPPANCAVLIHKRSARGGRRGRGRLFVPWFIAEGDVAEDGTLTPATVAAIQTPMTSWLNLMSLNNVPMYLLHQTGQTAQGPPDLVVSLNVDPLISTQRRRLGR